MRFLRLQRVACAVLLTLLGLILGLSPQAKAQSYAALHGTVVDSSGAVLSGATVIALNTSTGIKTVVEADKNGYFILPQLQVGGPYTVTISDTGFQSFETKGLVLNVNDNREVDATLNVGKASQTVEVSATAMQVETSNTQLQQIETAADLEEIPLEGRDPAGLQKLEPGVVESSDRFGSFSSNGNETAQNSYLLNGVDINDPALQSEGIQINPDALQEENIVTSTMNPEFARNSGAVVNQVLKSGSNTFHGSGFEFYRDTFMNNGNYFSQPLTPGGSTKQEFHQNLYGGTLGGPIFKNKLFFFLAYQGLRNRSALNDVTPTMDSDQLAGNFTNDANLATHNADSAGLSSKPIPFAIGNCPAGEAWNACFAPNSAGVTTVNIPTAIWNSVASGLTGKFVPQANYGAPDANGQQNLVEFNPENTSAQDQGIMRFDYTPSGKDSIWASTVFQSSPATTALSFGGGSFPGFGSTEANHYKLFSVSYTHTFSANKLNELRASYYRNPFGATEPSKVVAPSSAGFSINPQDPQSGLPFIAVGSDFDLGFSYEGPQPRLDTNLTYADSFTWIKGNHSIKFGGQFEQFRVHNPFDIYNNGEFSFQGSGTYSSGDPYIDYALGIPDAYYQSNNGFINSVAAELYGYVQDNWKVSPDFTFNYGITWDVERPNEAHQDGGLGVNCWANSSSESNVFPGASPGLSFPGDPGCNSAGGPVAHYDHFGPRIGFAWSPSSGPSQLIGTPGAHDFSLRAGFGVYYNRDQEEQALQNLEDPPFLKVSLGAGDVGGSPSFANPFQDVTGNPATSEANPFPMTPVTPTSTINWTNFLEEELSVFDKNSSVPYTYNFNVNIQRALGANLIAQVGYVGSISHRLASWYEGDPITPAGHAACLANANCNTDPYFDRSFPQYMTDTQNYYGYPYYLSVAEQDTEGSSNYNSFQASLRKAPSHGLMYTISYTYGHSLDDGSGYESSTGAAGRDHISTPGFTYLNYGSSDFDVRHRIVGSYAYTVPVAGFLKSKLIAREALSGWEVAGVTALETGFPVGINMGVDDSYWCSADSYFGCGDNPEWTGASIQRENIRATASHQYFSTSTFSPETTGTYGNTPRNFFHGPGFNYTNLQVSKNVPFSADGKRSLQIRLEAFNAFNHANFANPSGNFSSPTFGSITSVVQTADPNGDPSPGRSIQIATKIFF